MPPRRPCDRAGVGPLAVDREPGLEARGPPEVGLPGAGGTGPSRTSMPGGRRRGCSRSTTDSANMCRIGRMPRSQRSGAQPLPGPDHLAGLVCPHHPVHARPSLALRHESPCRKRGSATQALRRLTSYATDRDWTQALANGTSLCAARTAPTTPHVILVGKYVIANMRNQVIGTPSDIGNSRTPTQHPQNGWTKVAARPPDRGPKLRLMYPVDALELIRAIASTRRDGLPGQRFSSLV
jgi:hypothetical protein